MYKKAYSYAYLSRLSGVLDCLLTVDELNSEPAPAGDLAKGVSLRLQIRGSVSGALKLIYNFRLIRHDTIGRLIKCLPVFF